MKSGDCMLQVEVLIALSKGRKNDHRTGAAGPKPPEPLRIPRIARLMALALKFQDMVDRGEVRDYADIARLGYVSRARITQIMNLLNLAPCIQEALLLHPGTTTAIQESRLRCITSEVLWQDQRRLCKKKLVRPDRAHQRSSRSSSS